MKESLKDYLIAAKYASERVFLIKKELAATLGTAKAEQIIKEVTEEVNNMQFDHTNDPLTNDNPPPEDEL